MVSKLAALELGSLQEDKSTTQIVLTKTCLRRFGNTGNRDACTDFSNLRDSVLPFVLAKQRSKWNNHSIY